MSLFVAPGDLIAGKYRVEGVIGRGGMGVVVGAMHLQLDRRVAIKLLHPEVARNPELVERFAREARAAGKIQSEHVARVLDVGTLDNGAPFMVMEHLAGSDLSDLVKRRGALPAPEVIEYVLQACEALAEAHVAGIVHRDLKPANLFLTVRPDGSPSVKILDFGISKIAAGEGQGITQTSAMMGSPSYMAPEQLRSARDVDARTDVWALGIILHELLTGEGAFRADTVPELYVAILQKPPTPLRAVRPEAPPALEALILRCLEKDPALRFASVAALAAAFGDLAPPRARPSVDRIARIFGVAAPAAFAPTVVPDVPPSRSAPPPSPPQPSSGPPALPQPSSGPPAPPQPSSRPPAPPHPSSRPPMMAATHAQAPGSAVRAAVARSQPRAPNAHGGAPLQAPARHGYGQHPQRAYPYPPPGASFGPQGPGFGPPGASFGPPAVASGPAEPRLSSAAIVLIVLVALVVLGGGSCVVCFALGDLGRESQSSVAR